MNAITPLDLRTIAAGRGPSQPAADALVHDLNHLLTIVLGASERLAGQLPEGAARDLAEVCVEAAERAAQVSARLRDAEAPQSSDPAIDTGEALDGAARFLRALAPGALHVRTRLEAAPHCRAARADLDRALLNLALNARDATPHGGTVTLESRVASVGLPLAFRMAIAPGAYARLSVRDTGAGMTAEVKARALDPYFTTKGADGTGLGLASVEAFARAAGGGLEILSAPGEGCEIALYLPLATH